MMKLIGALLKFANTPKILRSDYTRVVFVAWVLIRSITAPLYTYRT